MNPQSEQTALIQTSREWARAAEAGDIEAALSFWADDAIVMAPGQPTVVGKPAIREFLRQSLAIPGFSISWEPEHASISGSGDLGYMVERNRISFTNADGTRQTQFGKAVTIWRKSADGHWKCVVDTWNDNPMERALPPA